MNDNYLNILLLLNWLVIVFSFERKIVYHWFWIREHYPLFQKYTSFYGYWTSFNKKLGLKGDFQKNELKILLYIVLPIIKIPKDLNPIENKINSYYKNKSKIYLLFLFLGCTSFLLQLHFRFGYFKP